jgi:peptidoglycan/LPS O-acetylase OafA/YrhL
MTRRHHLPALTGLRFVLAIWVIIHHLTGRGMMLEPWVHTLPAGLQALVRGGYLAVGTFFVLSGFVLARSYGEKSWNRGNLLRYGIARIARVYPGYLLSLAIVSPFIYRALFNGGSAVDRRAALLADYGLVLQGWTGSLGVGWNTPAWSLSCEMFFYLSFPLAAVAVARAGWRQTIAVAAAATCLTRVLWACGVPDGIKPVIHLSDFLMGVAAARIYDLLGERGWRRSGVWLYGPALVLSAALIARPDWLPPRVDLNSALRPLNALLLIGLAIGGGTAARALSTRLAVYLGKASYAMYILHVPMLWWYLRWAREASASVYISAVIAVSALVYRFVEEPANRWLRARVQVALQP